MLLTQIKLVGLPEPEIEYRFHPTRRWRFDFCYPDLLLAIEVDGGIYTQGRHTRGKGYENDLRKFGAAMELGWSVYRCSTGMVESGEAIRTIETLYRLAIERLDNVRNTG